MQKFRKAERLCSRKSFGKLFSSGKTIFHFPYRLVWIENDREDCIPAKIAISVPKKKFKKAVDRNRIKRLIRESYRLNKYVLFESLDQQNRKVDLIVIYIADIEYNFDFLNSKMLEIIHKLIIHGKTGEVIF